MMMKSFPDYGLGLVSMALMMAANCLESSCSTKAMPNH
jgi:hypothetical protein